MISVENTLNTNMPLSVRGSFETVDLPEENRSGVMKIVNPGSWNVAYYKLAEYKDQIVSIKFSVDVKRVGAAGDLRWQVSNGDYPTVGNAVINAEADTWYTMSGEWTGSLIHNRVFYLSTHKNNSKTTTYYIDNFNIEIESKGKKAKKDLSHLQKPLKDVAQYLKDLIPASIPDVYSFKTMFMNIADEESIRNGVLAYRDFLYLFCDRLIADGNLYDKPPKKSDSHLSIAAAYPFLNNAKNVLFNIGYYGKATDNGSSLLLCDWQLLTSTISAGGEQATLKLSVPKVVEALRFLTDCGFNFEGVDIDAPKPDMSKVSSISVTYPDNPAVLTGLKVMAVAQKDLIHKHNDEVFLRCDYRVLSDAETDITSLLKDYVRPLPAGVQGFALKLHQRYLDAGLTCYPKVSFLNLQFIYSYKNKELWSFFASLVAGYRILIKAQNTQKYADVIKNFPLHLQEKIAKGYGCEKSRFDEPCQKGCHGFSFPLNDSIHEISNEVEIWLDKELTCLQRK